LILIINKAESLKMTAEDLLKLGVIDEIVKEPLGGAHLQPLKMFRLLKRALRRNLKELENLSPEELVLQRENKFYSMGQFIEK
jgi:acetyl-CoA carboxylase carboxyl transferase subunit alpha